MKKNEEVWARTMLIAYKYLESIINAIDKTFDKTVKASFYMGGSFNDRYNTEAISQRLINLSNKKVDYINIKVLVEKVLSKMDKKYAKALILRYIKEINLTTICNLLNISERTFFRRLNMALKSFGNCLNELGYNYEKLEVTYLTDSFIKSIYNLNEDKSSKTLRNDEIVSKYLYNFIYDINVCRAGL